MEKMKIFNLYSTEGIEVEDPGLKRYINLDQKLVLRSLGRSKQKFGKSKVNIVERLANLLAVPGHRGKKHKIITGHSSGKYESSMKRVLECFKLIEKRTGKNPIAVLVKAIENASPRDEITVIEYGGARYPQAVDVSPLRRVNITLRNMVHGAYDKAFNKKARIEETLADEIIFAYEGKMDSFAMGKRNESEKQADSAR
jgi:small subunit ribosomal protein S7